MICPHLELQPSARSDRLQLHAQRFSTRLWLLYKACHLSDKNTSRLLRKNIKYLQKSYVDKCSIYQNNKSVYS